MTITEPTTLLTDYLLAALTAGFASMLWRAAGKSEQVSQRQWAGAFAAAALAAALGGSWHGFQSSLPPLLNDLLWRLTTTSIGLAGLLFLLGGLYASLEGVWRIRLTRLAIVKFLLSLVIVNLTDAYVAVIADYAPNLLVLLGLGLWRIRVAAFAPWCIAGIVVALIAAAVQITQLSLHTQFNHNDLYHLVQAVSFWLLYRAGMLLADRG